MQPVDEDGVVASATGTVAFAAASVILAVYREELAAQGNGWWLLVAVAGVLIGLCATGYTTWRRRQRLTLPEALPVEPPKRTPSEPAEESTQSAETT